MKNILNNAKFTKFSFLSPYFDSQFEQFRVQKISHIFYFHFNIFIFENKVAGKKCNLTCSPLLWNALYKMCHRKITEKDLKNPPQKPQQNIVCRIYLI